MKLQPRIMTCTLARHMIYLSNLLPRSPLPSPFQSSSTHSVSCVTPTVSFMNKQYDRHKLITILNVHIKNLGIMNVSMASKTIKANMSDIAHILYFNTW